MVKRRKLITTLATVGTVSLAGCSDVFDDEMVVDEIVTASAGETLTYRYDLEEDDVITINARLIGDGARPAVEVENPSGATVEDIGPSEEIDTEVTARESGRYYILFENEAFATSGQWDIQIELDTGGFL